MYINLKDGMFTDKESLFVDDGSLKAYLYRFESGICAVKLQNSEGFITVLPCNAKEKGIVPRYLRLLYHALWNPCNGLPLAGG